MCRMSGQVLFGDLVFPLASLTVDHGDTVGFGEGMQAAAEAARHTHKMGIIQLLVRAVPQPAPPGSEPSRGIAERIESVQYDTIHTSVTAVKERGVIAAQFVGHNTRTLHASDEIFNCPAGATFSERSLGKSVEILKSKIWCK
jgi:hypothetical protein